ncbi:unnamed protein product [Sympodiomycopsis kandeliae]
MKRLQLDHHDIKEKVCLALGQQSNREGLGDPFGIQPHPIASHRSRDIQSHWHTLSTRITTYQTGLLRNENDIGSLRERIESKRAEIHTRRQRLHQAEQLQSNSSTNAKGTVEKHIRHSRVKLKQVNELLYRARKSKLLAVIRLFDVRCSTNSLNTGRYPGAYNYSPSPGSRGTRTGAGEWTILSPPSSLQIPLPTISDLSRYSRQDLNASVATSTQVLLLMAGICNIILPFPISLVPNTGKYTTTTTTDTASQGGMLHLGKSAYSHLCQQQQQQQRTHSTSSVVAEGSPDASMMSTLTSTFESFVQLPRSFNNPSDQSTSPDHSNNTLTSYRIALSTLYYNASYLNWTQGLDNNDTYYLSAINPILSQFYHCATSNPGYTSTKSMFGLLPPHQTILPPEDKGGELRKVLQLFGVPFGLDTRHQSEVDGKKEGKMTSIEESYVDAGNRAGNKTSIGESYIDAESRAGKKISIGEVHTSGKKTLVEERSVTGKTLMEESYIDAGKDAASVVLRDRQHVTSGLKDTASSSSPGDRKRTNVDTSERSRGASKPAIDGRQALPPGGSSKPAIDGRAGQSSVNTRTTSSSHRILPHSKPLSTANTSRLRQQVKATTTSTTPSATHMESLRQRGQLARGTVPKAAAVMPPPVASQRAIPSNATWSTRSRPGTVTFNGKEIKGKHDAGGQSGAESADGEEWEAV